MLAPYDGWAWAGAAKRSDAIRASAVPVVAIFQRRTRDTDVTLSPPAVRNRLADKATIDTYSTAVHSWAGDAF